MALVEEAERKRRRLGRLLAGVFILALVMGPGPGIYLVNPSPDAAAPWTVWGIPVLYVWAVSWFFVMAATVVLAYRKVWLAGDSD